MTITAQATTTQTATYSWGDKVTFTNRWGQQNCTAIVMHQTGNVLVIDYLGCQHEITLDQLS